SFGSRTQFGQAESVSSNLMRSDFRLYARLAALALIDPLLTLPAQLPDLRVAHQRATFCANFSRLSKIDGCVKRWGDFSSINHSHCPITNPIGTAFTGSSRSHERRMSKQRDARTADAEPKLPI